MKGGMMRPKRAGLILALLIGTAVGPLHAGENDLAAGRVMAASWIGQTCKGSRLVGDGDDNSFVMAATEILAEQGFRRQKMRTILFYGSTESLTALAADALAARGVDVGDKGAVCRFGKSVAGTTDPIGQFLLKGK
jgi:hypothetical protein